ncbi:hypothetical protein FQA39_LY07591 [Lamprigera yunnana]|nr:hypothetical protein FQA39_LY07591 [Lamprigera yunnana]
MSMKSLPYFVAGEVVKGFGRGSKQLGIPTANYPSSVVQNLPTDLKNGVYFGFGCVNKSTVYKMVMSVGWNPYYKNKEKSMETHLLHNFDKDFYGEELRVCILGYIRGEKDFNSVGELVEAIQLDVEISKEKLDLDDVNVTYRNYKLPNRDFLIKMSLSTASKLGIRLIREAHLSLLKPFAASTNVTFVRSRMSKHYNPKFKYLRRLKIVKIELPKFNEDPDKMTEEEIRSKLKEKGVLPRRPWNETQYFISSTGSVFEAYVPPEGDGKISPITLQGAKQKVQFLEKKTKTMLAIRKIRSYEEDFDTPEFCKKAEDIYIKAHELITSKDRDEELIKYVTERAYPELIHNVENKTIHWKFIKNIELPRVVHARYTDVITKENIFAQVTVRFHTQQVLAIYDRFGRLLQGSEIIAKDVLEYVVFEKHIANEYGIWRIHSKIIPDWLPPREITSLTYKDVSPLGQDEEDKSVIAKKSSVEVTS